MASNLQADVRSAQKQYTCRGGPYHICNKIIRPGDAYFAITFVSPQRYRTHRYCLECAQLHHRDLLRQATASIRSERKWKTAGTKVARMKFLGLKAKQLKRKMSEPEKFLWDYLRSKRLGVRFYHQTVLHGYVVDFWCPEKQLVVELDGSQHRATREADQRRDQILQVHGLRVLRFPSALVFSDLQFLLDRIRETFTQRSTR